jgi:hypothetical protein
MTRFAAVFFFLLTAPALAQAPQYCAMFYDGGRSCGIPTLAMCQETVRGVGGSCEIDTFSDLPKGLMQQLMEKRLEELTDSRPPAVLDLQAVPPPPVR